MSWLNGKQPGFQMVGGLHSGRSVLHLAKTFELADQAGLLKDPAAGRLPDVRLPADQRGGRMSADFSRLSLNSATTKKWTLAEAVDGCVRAGIPAIGPWRDRVAEAGLDKAASLIKDAGLRVSSLCRGGFLTAADAEGQAAALADNRAGHPRSRGAGHPGSCSWWLAASLRARRTSWLPASASPTGSRTWFRSPPRTASGWCWNRCTRCTPRTAH